MLELKNITKVYTKGDDRFPALDNVTLTVERGDFIAVVGPSGSGKSTLLHTVGGLNQPDNGQVLYDSEDVYKMHSRKANLYRRKSVGFVFQQFHLIPYLTVSENIKVALDEPGSRSQKINELLEKCAMSQLQNKYPSELSVGEKQRTAFIRAIISEPDILLADEPTGNLDPENSRVLMSLINDFNKNRGTVLLVSHEVETTSFANRVITLHSGKVINK
ncbi:ABC transporter ATP-binding protein [Prolixibacteraceae bacterium Z1-6]|uniref:ABC transporter ATP-binding protein n=1 Tax=Draconibacterium aestuarii TaxID=2998507 RepID=A0A9X3F3A6_9BACT|nr:ABC transporter ATP-binding protein [Prolixibacteraceae bacterium Z1-6]